MARLITDSPVATAQGPWYLTTTIVCPFCARPFVLTPENVLTTLAANIGATGTRHIGWQQLDENRAIDSAHLNIDPAQVEGECPYCHYFPVNKHGPRYGLAKVTLNTDTTASDVQGFVAGGAVAVAFYQTSKGALVGVYFTVRGTPYSTDASGATATGVVRLSSTTLNTAYPFLFHTPSRRLTVSEARTADSDLCAYLERFGLTLI